ncbi:unnamed protein product (macronuclear) [Paramecium tetraurelia]|uniref:Transmembrane protein n=1 Tax=Paramecium tetraurelia TaxID=5888 RepID=A0EEG0_PARTE|nr:uncharacterized protein GSPATT00026023001 [Paramecium tetraurelia]CAK93684.1 unnamed protein product [Paramecium tetraurelia]|eukprot:XP_001461074.1 hypothetical protein (macronuclear) [Paramecium tetraurelia strain d4-2]
MDFLASFDKFGAVYKPKIKQEQKNYQTVFGGIISIMIYMVSFIYFCYKIYQFGKNEVNPIQSIAYEYTQNLTMADNKDFLSFEVLGTQINPFNRTSQILVPMMIFQGYEQMEQQAFFTQDDIYNNNEVDFDIQKYTPKNISLQNGVGDYPHKVLIVLRICDSKTQTNCADDAVIDSFFNQNNLLIRTTVQTEQYNSFHRSINNMSTEMIFALDRSATFYQRVIMQAQLLEIDEAPLFPTYDSKWIFSDQFIQTQSLGQSFKSNFPALFITELSMSSVTQKKVVQYIKVSQVLADVGSIFSSLMLFSIIISTFNEFLMEQELIKQVIEIYYPQFSKFEFRRLLNFGPISEVRFEGKTVDLDQFQKFYENAKTIAKNKLTVHNSIYQTSRLQFAIQGLVAREALKKLKSQGIKLNLNYDNNFKSPRENQVQGSKSSVIEYQEIEDHVNLQFTDGDFNLLDEEDNSQHEKQKINEENQENH